MPSATRRQQQYLAHKYGWSWVKKHHFDKVEKKSTKKVKKEGGGY